MSVPRFSLVFLLSTEKGAAKESGGTGGRETSAFEMVLSPRGGERIGCREQRFAKLFCPPSPEGKWGWGARTVYGGRNQEEMPGEQAPVRLRRITPGEQLRHRYCAVKP